VSLEARTFFRPPLLRTAAVIALLGAGPLLPALSAQVAPPAATIAGEQPDPQDGSASSRPDHLWSADYLRLLWGDTGAVLTAPTRWDENDWLDAGLAGALVGGTAAFDRSIKDHVQAHRTAGQDRFMKQWQNFGRTWAFGVLGVFEVWGEAGGDSTAKATAMDGLTASLIGPGLIGTTLKEVVGRVRPNSETRTFEFKPFSGNMSFPSGDAFEAFTVATAISEHYRAWWVQTLCYGTAGLVGYARIEQNGHHASDVVAGAILGWSITRAIVRRHDRPKPRRINWAPYTDGTNAGLVFYKSF
jgi:membrane-associated phospholipid phosphatase